MVGSSHHFPHMHVNCPVKTKNAYLSKVGSSEKSALSVRCRILLKASLLPLGPLMCQRLSLCSTGLCTHWSPVPCFAEGSEQLTDPDSISPLSQKCCCCNGAFTVESHNDINLRIMTQVVRSLFKNRIPQFMPYWVKQETSAVHQGDICEWAGSWMRNPPRLIRVFQKYAAKVSTTVKNVISASLCLTVELWTGHIVQLFVMFQSCWDGSAPTGDCKSSTPKACKLYSKRWYMRYVREKQ